MRSSYDVSTVVERDDALSKLFEYVYPQPKVQPREKRRFTSNWKALYSERPLFSSTLMKENPLYGLRTSVLIPWFSGLNNVPRGSSLMLRVRSRFSPTRPT